jgi:hypothetical protein
MKLWLISQTGNDDYDTYDSAVVAAESEDDARNVHPSNSEPREFSACWVDPSKVTVKLIGTAAKGTERGVICASFNAG